MTAADKPPRTNAWAAHLAALGLVPLFGALAAGGLAAQTVGPRPHDANVAVAFADDGQDDGDKPETDDKDKKDDPGTRLESRLRELSDRFVKELGPAGEELRKVWDRAISRANETIEEEGLSGDGLRDAIDSARDEIGSAMEKGSPVDRRVRQALDRLRRELSEAGEESSRDLRESVRRRFHADGDQDDEKPKTDDDQVQHEPKAGESSTHEQIDAARKEVRELERKLHQAVRQLYVLQRRAAQEDRPQGRRRGPAEGRRPGPEADESRDRPRPPDAPEAESDRRGREPREMPPSGMDRRRGGMGRGPFGGPRPGPEIRQQLDNDRRFKALEEKMDKILKQLDRANDGKKAEETSKKTKGDEDD